MIPLRSEDVPLPVLPLLAILPPEYYNHVPIFSSASVGAHVRHIFDHYDSYIVGIQQGKVDYDERRRDLRIETNVDVARLYGLEQIRQLDATEELTYRDIVVYMTLNQRQSWKSSQAQELRFLFGHTLHHMAMIQYILTSQDYPLPKSFGVAQSTLNYHKCAP